MTTKGKLVRNAIKCKACGDVIESKALHDFITCSCGACSVDGGLMYPTRRWDTKYGMEPVNVYEELSEYDTPGEEDQNER